VAAFVSAFLPCVTGEREGEGVRSVQLEWPHGARERSRRPIPSSLCSLVRPLRRFYRLAAIDRRAGLTFAPTTLVHQE